MAALLLAISPVIALALVLLVMVVAGIRQEPPTVELRSQPPSRVAALVRRLLGVSVRRPDPHAADDDRTPESSVAGHSAAPEWHDR